MLLRLRALEIDDPHSRDVRLERLEVGPLEPWPVALRLAGAGEIGADDSVAVHALAAARRSEQAQHRALLARDRLALADRARGVFTPARDLEPVRRVVERQRVAL